MNKELLNSPWYRMDLQPWSSTLQRLSAGVFLSVLISFPHIGYTQALSDQQIAETIVRASRNAYYQTGRPCACPDDHARNGSRCGGRSAYNRPGGAAPKCYVSDITAAEIATFRARQR
jgi:hypothetical protein